MTYFFFKLQDNIFCFALSDSKSNKKCQKIKTITSINIIMSEEAQLYFQLLNTCIISIKYK